MGGTRSTYRGNSTSLFQLQGNRGDGGAGGSAGGGGGNTSNKTNNNGSSSTGGIQNGGGNGNGGGASATDVTTKVEDQPTTDVTKDISQMNDAEIDALFVESDAYDLFEEKMGGSTGLGGADGRGENYDVLYNRAKSRWLTSQQKPTDPKEQKAIDELKAALAQYNEVMTRTERSPYIEGSSVDLERRAASNRLTNAQAPFQPQFGKYQWPADIPTGFGLNYQPTTEPAEVKPAPPVPQIEVNFRSRTRTATKTEFEAKIAKMPENIRQRLGERGLKIHLATKSGRTERWNAYAVETGTDQGDQMADGRAFETISFYDPTTNEIFVSTSTPTGSYNVMVHEMAHGVDATWLAGEVDVDWTTDLGEVFHYKVSEISRDDPDFVWLHDNYILNNPDILPYFRGGASGTNDAHGRSELFAESMAAYFENGREGLDEFLSAIPEGPDNRDYVIDTIIAVWARYGIIGG